MKAPSFLLAFAVLATVTSMAHADYLVTISINSPDAPKAKEYIVKIKGAKMRTEMSDGNAMIADRDAGTRILLKAKTKQATDMSAFGKGMPDILGKDKDKPKPKVVATGKKETVAGYEAEEYTYDMDEDSKISLWVAKDYPKDKADVLTALYKNSPARTFSEMPDLSTLPGPVIRSVMKDKDGKPQIDSVVKSVTEAGFDDKEFEVPSDYTVKKMPALPGARKQPKSN